MFSADMKESMQLLHKIKYINRIEKGDRTEIQNDTLSINVGEIEKFLKTKLKTLDSIVIELVNKSEEKRICKIFDVIEPRMKIKPVESDYPGVISRVKKIGYGETAILKRVAVVLVDRRKKDWKPIIEHTDEYSGMSSYADINLICLDIKVKDGLEGQKYYENLYKAGLLLSIYICKTIDSNDYDERIILTDQKKGAKRYKIGYYFQLCSAQYATQKTGPVFLGAKAENLIPTVISPTMAIDGAITRNFFEEGFDTYHIQNNSVVHSLLKDNEIDFKGVVIAISSLNNIDRERYALVAANLFKNFLKVDAVIMTKAFGGASNLDLENLANMLSEEKIISIPIIQVTSIEERLSDALIFKTDIFRHLVCSGWTHEKVIIPNHICTLFGPDKDILDSKITLEIEFIKGVIDNLGSAKLKVLEV